MALVISAVTALGANKVRMLLTGTANAQTATLGLFGDGTASANLPASWVGNSIAQGSTVDVGDGQGQISLANLIANTRITAVPVSGTKIGAVTGNSNLVATKGGAAPWQITFAQNGTQAGGSSVFEVYVEFLQSVVSGGSI